MRSQQHTAHTHTTDLKPSIAPIKVPLSAPPPLTSSREGVATDNVETPPHRRESRGRRPTAPRRHHSHRRSQRPCVSELRLMMPRRLAIVVQSGVDQRRQMTSSLSRSGFDRRCRDTGRDTGNACRLRRRRGGQGQVTPQGK